jgi:hypothetical protein
VRDHTPLDRDSGQAAMARFPAVVLAGPKGSPSSRSPQHGWNESLGYRLEVRGFFAGPSGGFLRVHRAQFSFHSE